MFKVNLRGCTKMEEYIAQHLLDDYIDLMGKDLSGIELTIQHDTSRPITCPKFLNPGQKEDFIIYLCHQSDYWCQMIYQLAHELGHFFMDCYPKQENIRWIDECICELFSLIFLNRSIKYFEKISPQYIQPAKNYIAEVVKNSLAHSNLSCEEFVNQKLGELETNPTEDGVKGRPRNNYIAAKLFDTLGCDGRGISAVCLFSELNGTSSSKEFFELWLQQCLTDDEIFFVAILREQLKL